METLPRGLAARGTNLGPLHIRYFSNEGSCQHAPLAPRVRLKEAHNRMWWQKSGII